MEPTVEWIVDRLEWDPQTGGVSHAKWRVAASQGEHFAAVPGVSNFDPNPDSESFIPLENLSPETVVAWIKSTTYNAEATEQRALDRLAEVMKPPRVTGLPW